MVDLLYVSHNRKAFTEATFPALLANTNWDLVNFLFVLDDNSTDGTAEFLREHTILDPRDRPFRRGESRSDKFGGPVAAMNYAVDNAETDVLVKIDNDLLVCPGWLDALLSVLAVNPQLDVLGFEAGFGEGLAPADAERTSYEARHVGGIGAIRTRIFRGRRPKAHGTGGRFGWTEFQRHHARCAWLTPDLACFAVDRLPFEPWVSLSAEYLARGWQRTWPQYPEDMGAYWSWAFESKMGTAGSTPAIPEPQPVEEAEVEQTSYERRPLLGEGQAGG